MVGAMSAELWRIIGERQELVALADAASIAAASGIDLDHYRSTGEALLDVDARGESGHCSAWLVRAAAVDLSAAPLVAVAEDRRSVRVELQRRCLSD